MDKKDRKIHRILVLRLFITVWFKDSLKHAINAIRVLPLCTNYELKRILIKTRNNETN